MLPYFAAKCKGVNPFLVVAVSDAPFSNKTDATCNESKKNAIKYIIHIYCYTTYIMRNIYELTSS